MPYLDGIQKTTKLQKALIVLFIITITLSCLSLVWIQLEKPGKVTTRCERISQFMSSHNFTEGNNSLNLSKLTPSCPTTINPPMSPGLELCINLAAVSGIVFVILSAYTYITRKKKEEPPIQ